MKLERQYLKPRDEIMHKYLCQERNSINCKHLSIFIFLKKYILNKGWYFVLFAFNEKWIEIKYWNLKIKLL